MTVPWEGASHEGIGRIRDRERGYARDRGTHLQGNRGGWAFRGFEGFEGSVDSRELSAVTSVGEYDVLVVGSAIHNGQWLPDATAALDRLGADLGGRAVWAYPVSSVGATSSLLSPRVARYLRRATPEPKAVQALRATADVRGHRFFAGTIAPGDRPGAGRIVCSARIHPAE